MFGPTVGDRVRLADMGLWVEVEKDFTVYGDECKFGGGEQLSAPGNCDWLDRIKERSCATVKAKHRTAQMQKSLISSLRTSLSSIGAAYTR